MLQPSDRRHLFESLRPPDGYALDYAIGTNFTLDLLALLTAPLAFTTFSWIDENGYLTHSPHALLATMQQYADRITLFCQTGKMTIPAKQSLLYSYLEGSVIEVDAPRPGGIFHPKIWLLRFTAPHQPILYRFLCLSRNLTFDRSWDTVLLLDGQLIEGNQKIETNQALSDFVAALPQLAHNQVVAESVKTKVAQIATELRHVQFEPPAGFEQLRFHALGLTSPSSFPIAGSIDRLMVISPFVSETRLTQLSQLGQRNILISRPEALDQIGSAALDAFEQLYQISPAANPEDANLEEIDETNGISSQAHLVGLHAKLYIADAGQHARIWTGSANATDAAFARNVEFLVELVGRKQQFGIDALLAFQDSQVTFRSLLEPFTPPPEPIEFDDTVLSWASEAERLLLNFHLTAQVLPTDEADQYCLQLRFEGSEPMQFNSNVWVCCYPMTRRDLSTRLSTQTAGSIEFKPLSCQALTPFIAFEIWTSDDKQKISSFLLKVPIDGMPANRRQHILRSLLQDKNQVLKLLLFLLADGQIDVSELIDPLDGGTGSNKEFEKRPSNGSTSSPFLFPLFEALVRALDHNPTKLDQVARLVDELRQMPPEEQLLPDQFEEIWQPIYTVRQELNR